MYMSTSVTLQQICHCVTIKWRSNQSINQYQLINQLTDMLLAPGNVLTTALSH